MSLDIKRLQGTVTIADGAWSTELQARGFDPNAMAEAANLERADLVAALVRDYTAAGSRIVTTNTFGANRFNLKRRNLTSSVEELNQAGVQLARKSAGRGAGVVGSVGPSGKILVVREASEEDVAGAFTEQIRALAESGADAILLETFSELAEILLALRVAKEVCKLPVIASMSFDSGPQRTRTMMGAEAAVCATALEEAGADVIGCNCGAGIAHALPSVVALRAATARPLWVKPSAGLPEVEDGRAVYRQPPEEFAALAPMLVEAGANVIGGCCGTGPEHIKRLVSVLRV